MRRFVEGRKTTFRTLEEGIGPDDQFLWFHCASLGEFEQGFPIMEAVRAQFPSYKILVSFFSPSGYEIKKNTPIADLVVYLPMDTPSNAKKFVRLVQPKLACFVKYEFWPNYLFELKKKDLPTLLISGTFRKDQIFFQWYGGFMRKALASFTHLFVQNAASEALLKKSGFRNVTVSGDTRFDRVTQQITVDNSLDFMEAFKGDALCLVCGSTWPADEAVLIPFINSAPAQIKIVVAPHKIEESKLQHFEKQLSKTVFRYSQLGTDPATSLKNAEVLLVDTIGLLTKIYSYADVAYVGGAMGDTGLHNILEPATFGIPILIGKNFKKFPEAERLRSLAGLYAIESAAEFNNYMNKFISDTKFRAKTGMIAGHFIQSNTGATAITLVYMKKHLVNSEPGTIKQ